MRNVNRMICLVLSFCVFPVWAQFRMVDVPKGRNLIGVGVSSAPTYFGSDSSETKWVPLINMKVGDSFFIGGRGLGFDFGGNTPLSYGFNLSYVPSRLESDDSALKGMGDLDARFVYGVFGGYRSVYGVSFATAWSRGYGNNREGQLFQIDVGFGVHLFTRTRGVFGIRTHYANQAYMQSYFGVTSQQSNNSGYAVYTPEAGWRDVMLSFSIQHRLSERFVFSAGISRYHWLRRAGLSPLVKDPIYLSSMIGVSYTF